MQEVSYPRTSDNSGVKLQVADRKKVFDSFWGAWKTYEGTMGAVLTTQIMGDVFGAKTRRTAAGGRVRSPRCYGAASVTTDNFSSGTESNFCRCPLDQRISTESSLAASPSPMVTGNSDCDK